MSSGSDLAVGIAAEAVMGAIVLGVIYRVWGGAMGLPKPTKIQPFQRGVLMKGEVVDRVLEPGTHWVSPKRTIFLCDTRAKPFQLNSQDVMAAPERWIRVSMRGATQVVDPARYVTASADSLAALYTDFRRLITEAAQGQSTYGRLEDTARLETRLKSLLAAEAERLGLTVVSLDVWEIVPLYPQRMGENKEPVLPVQ